jgi:sirohydrochlorin cobaltochelatase
MSPSHRPGRVMVAATASLLLFAGTLYAQEDHSHHHDHNAVPEMDAQGKRLTSYDQRHEMTPEARTELRRKVAVYRGMTDRELDMNMNAMGPDYAWYVSDPKLRGNTGVLVLAHGVGENSDATMKKSFEPLAAKQPMAIAFGMAMMSSAHIQAAVDDLAARGAKHIILVDGGTTTAFNTLTRHWQYIFGMYPEASYMDVPRVKAPPGVTFSYAGHMNERPVITAMLYENIKSVSKDPKNEVVLIVGHGPEDKEDNIPDLKLLQAHVDRLKAKNEFADVKIINLQDDAILPVRESNVRKLRSWVQQADRAGKRVIVAPIAVASYGVQVHIKNDLRGLNYTFAERGFAENPKFVDYVGELIRPATTSASH